MRALWSAVLDLFLPRACARCGAALAGDRALCTRCAASFPRLPLGGCPVCQSTAAEAGRRCPACQGERAPLAQVAAEVAFAGEAAEWIRRFKYPAAGLAGLDPRPAALAGALLADAARRLAAPVELVVPVPIHAGRLRERGFHPAAELAHALARALDVPGDPHALAQLRATASQTGLDRRARRRNVRGAFAARSGLRAPPSVALVDDVVTTGATLAEAARALRRAGARRVMGVCVARTM